VASVATSVDRPATSGPPRLAGLLLAACPLIFVNDVFWQATMVGDVEAVAAGPGPYLPTALAAGGRPDGRSRPPSPSEPAPLDEGG